MVTRVLRLGVNALLVVGVSLCFGLFEVDYNVCIQHNTAIRLHGISLASCARKCDCLDTCIYVNYKVKLLLCEIYDPNPGMNEQRCSGNVLINSVHVEDITVHINGKECSMVDANICNDFNKSNAKVLGNANAIGSERTFVCESSYAVNGENNTRCMESGVWSELGTCKTICNGINLMNIKMIVIQIEVMTSTGSVGFNSIQAVNMPLYEGTKLTLACIDGSVLEGNKEVNCVNGTWNQFPTCTGTMFKRCQTASDCTDVNSECRSNQCWCKPWLSYDPCRFSCVELCAGPYGDTFQIIEQYGLMGYNYQVHDEVNDIKECIDICLENSDQTYTCKSADYNYRYRLCFLNDIPSEEKLNLEYFETGYALLRDCAYCDYTVAL